MKQRREVLANLAAGAAAIPTFGWGTSATALDESAQATSPCDCSRPLRGPLAGYFPNVVVSTHEHERALFYDDLLRGKTVMINFMSVKNDAVYPVTENLVKVQRLLGDRVGRDVFMYSMTVDPEDDTPRMLAAFAERHGVGPGWLFLTGEPNVLDVLRDRFFAHGIGHHHGSGPVQDCSIGLVRYGNEAVGLWGSVPAKANPAWIAQRLSWVQPRPAPVGPPKRRGPMAPATGNPRRSQ